MDRPYEVLLADNHAGFRREMRKVLEEISGVTVTGEAGDRWQLFELLRQSPPKLVTLDIYLPDLRNFSPPGGAAGHRARRAQLGTSENVSASRPEIFHEIFSD